MAASMGSRAGSKAASRRVSELNAGAGAYTKEREMKLDNQIQELTFELRQIKQAIESNRERVRTMQDSISKMKSEKFEHESNMIGSLQQSQNNLRYQIQSAIQSKIELCTKTSQEINRLRKIIFIAQNGGENKEYNENDYDNNDGSNFNINDLNDDRNNKNSNNNNNRNDNDNRENFGSYQSFKLSRRFPKCDQTRIDKLTLAKGDGESFADICSLVKLRYTGYIVRPDSDATNQENWLQFTTEEINNTTFETRLSNNENIVGLEQAVFSMTQFEKALVWIPYRLAWGVLGAEQLIPPKSDIIFYLQLKCVDEGKFTWHLQRLLWIAHYKSNSSLFSIKSKFPKDLIRVIMSFLNINFDKQYYLNKKQNENNNMNNNDNNSNIFESMYNSNNNNMFGNDSGQSGSDNDMFIVDDSDVDSNNRNSLNRIAIASRNYNNNDDNNDSNNNNNNNPPTTASHVDEMIDEIHEIAHKRGVSLHDIDDYN